MKITQRAINLLKKHWKRGYIYRFEFPGGVKEELKRLGIIEYNNNRYEIKREVYLKLVSGKQKTLDIDNAKGGENGSKK